MSQVFSSEGRFLFKGSILSCAGASDRSRNGATTMAGFKRPPISVIECIRVLDAIPGVLDPGRPASRNPCTENQNYNKSVNSSNSFGSASTLTVQGNQYRYYSLAALEKARIANIARIPCSIRILLENLLRAEDGRTVKASDIEYVAKWKA